MDLTAIAILLLILVLIVEGHRYRTKPVDHVAFAPPRPSISSSLQVKNTRQMEKILQLDMEIDELKSKLDTMTTSREWFRDQVNYIRKTLG